MSQSHIVAFKNVSKSFGDTAILKQLNFQVSSGKITSLIGASGSGKTTTLRLINGLLKPSAGSIFMEGVPLNYDKIVSTRRKIGYCIQYIGLFPHMTVFENISLIPKRMKLGKKVILERSHSLMEMVGLSPKHHFHKKPAQLSGGEKQRVGMIRSLIMQPKLLLMDEPFGALDPITRREIQNEFILLQKRLNFTCVLVTHDLQEAFKLSHEIILLNQGKMEQKGKPHRFILNPASAYVEAFLHSNSPGQVLNDIFLYAVVNPAIWITIQKDSQYIVVFLETGEKKAFNTEREIFDFHRSQKQNSLYLCDLERRFLGLAETSSEKIQLKKDIKPLRNTQTLLTGLTRILDVSTTAPAIPIVDENNKIEGVFSEEAIRALA